MRRTSPWSFASYLASKYLDIMNGIYTLSCVCVFPDTVTTHMWSDPGRLPLNLLISLLSLENLVRVHARLCTRRIPLGGIGEC
jgi:hypothetical protein